MRPIYKSYPVYHPDREPKEYIEWLRSREPELDWDTTKLRTKEDWIRAGETVFNATLGYGSIMITKERRGDIKDLYVRKPAFYSAVQCEVRGSPVIVTDERMKVPAQTALVEYDHVIKAFATYCADDPFDIRTLPW